MNHPVPHIRCSIMISTVFLLAFCAACSPNAPVNSPAPTPVITAATRSPKPSPSAARLLPQKPVTSNPVTSNPVTSMSEITLSNADNGKTITLKPGQTLTLQLTENPTTGYRWSIVPFNDQLLKLSDDRFDLPNASGMGSGGQRILTFKATRTGQVNLTLNQKREWEDSALESFNLTLEIRE
jgi:inhibitor of cysteine peptidase